MRHACSRGCAIRSAVSVCFDRHALMDALRVTQIERCVLRHEAVQGAVVTELSGVQVPCCVFRVGGSDSYVAAKPRVARGKAEG